MMSKTFFQGAKIFQWGPLPLITGLIASISLIHSNKIFMDSKAIINPPFAKCQLFFSAYSISCFSSTAIEKYFEDLIWSSKVFMHLRYIVVINSSCISCELYALSCKTFCSPGQYSLACCRNCCKFPSSIFFFK